MVVSPAPADAGLSSPPTNDPERADPPRSQSFRLVLAAVLLVVTLAAAATAATLFATRGAESGDTQAGREDVMAQTEQFILRSFTYGPDLLAEDNTMPDYRDQVAEVITPKFRAEFDESAGAAEQLVAQAGVARVPDVFATGVSSLDADSARTLIAGSFTDTYTVEGKTVPQEPIPFRVEVTLVKIDGTWLVDNFNPVTAEGAVPESDIPAPSPSATAPTEDNQ